MESKHELENVNWGIIPIYNYHGTLVTRVYGKGYSVFGHILSTPEEVDELVMNTCSILSESVEKGRNSPNSCVNAPKNPENQNYSISYQKEE